MTTQTLRRKNKGTTTDIAEYAVILGVVAVIIVTIGALAGAAQAWPGLGGA